MPINESHVPRSYPLSEAFEITAAQVSQFANAIGDDHDSYHGANAVAPPTFAAVLAAQAWDQLFNDPELGLELSRTIHVDQRFTWQRQLQVGDQVKTRLSIEKLRLRGTTAIITIAVDIVDLAGENIAQAVSTLMNTLEVES